MSATSEIIDGIRQAHRERCFAMEQRKRTDLAMLSFLRPQLGWRKDLPAAERKAAADKALELVVVGERILRAEAKAAKKQQPRAEVEGERDPDFVQWRPLILATVSSRAPFDAIEKAAEKEMERLAAQLPVWTEFESVRGFGLVSLAVIVGEASNLGD